MRKFLRLRASLHVLVQRELELGILGTLYLIPIRIIAALPLFDLVKSPCAGTMHFTSRLVRRACSSPPAQLMSAAIDVEGSAEIIRIIDRHVLQPICCSQLREGENKMKRCGIPWFLGICVIWFVIAVYSGAHAANEITFDKPWTIYRYAGHPIEVVKVVLDSDINGDQIVIYNTPSGEEGFVDRSNVKNFDELFSLMNPGTNSQNTSDPDTIPDNDNENDSQKYGDIGNTAGSSEVIVAMINQMYGNICIAELNGFLSKTLKLDWTSNTNKLHAIKVLAEVGSVRDNLYLDGVRYFQFPNDAGGYNVIDWKSGEKKSISDRAPYYFSD